jgi:hypothetical protein
MPAAIVRKWLDVSDYVDSAWRPRQVVIRVDWLFEVSYIAIAEHSHRLKCDMMPKLTCPVNYAQQRGATSFREY